MPHLPPPRHISTLHLTGDRVLQGVAQLLQEGLRESDIAVRWGGEEFLLVLRGCDMAEAQRIAENLCQNVAQKSFEVGGKSLVVTISIGVAEYDGSELPEQWINRADTGLYTAKNAGRNRVGVAPPPAAQS